MLRVGLTGGIACGKTHVLRRLAARGCRTLDLDVAAREVVAPGSPALAEIVSAFGERVAPAGALDRAALAALVFADPAARARLDAIVHPRVRALEASWARSQQDAVRAVLVTDGALLVEAGAHLRFDRLVVVHCDPARQLERLRARDGLSEAAARARIEAQMPLAAKRAFAHFAIDSSGAPGDTDRETDAVFEQLRQLAARGRGSAEPPLPRLLGGLVHGPGRGPRGLRPLDVLALAAQAGGLELGALAERLDPLPGPPWYAAARRAPPGAPAAALGPALAAWALAWRPSDREFLLAAASSLARLTHDDPAERADACLLAVLVQEVALVGVVADDLASRAEALWAPAARWGGGEPSGLLRPLLAAALDHRRDPRAATAAASPAGDAAPLAGALVGAALGAPAQEAPALAAALARIAAGRPA